MINLAAFLCGSLIIFIIFYIFFIGFMMGLFVGFYGGYLDRHTGNIKKGL